MRTLLLLALIACGTEPAKDSGTTPAAGTTATGSTAAGTPTTGSTTGTPAGTPSTSTATDFRDRGPFGTTTASDSAAVATCTMNFTRYLPDGGSPSTLVVLSHGFQRNQGHVAALADHLASWGLAVVTPNLCHATAFDTDHAANAQDLVGLADTEGQGGPVIYVGHSAGGLATWLASSQDPNAVAHFGLDPVDSGQEGSAIVGTHGFATYALFAEPGPCNSNGNGTGWYTGGTDDQALRITGADHCDFEGPTDGLCTGFCGGGATEDALVRQFVTGATTAFVAWQAGIDASGENWWTAGTTWNDLLLTGSTPL